MQMREGNFLLSAWRGICFNCSRSGKAADC